MSRISKSTNRQPSTNSNDADQNRVADSNQPNSPDDLDTSSNGSPASRSSRTITIIGLCSVAAIIGAVLFTSERNGPGSESLTASSPVTSAADTASPTGCAATETMPGGDNFYIPNAPVVENLGTGLVVQGTVRAAGTCEPVSNTRIQIWLTTARGGEGEPSNRGSVITNANGRYRLETSPVVAQFGQPHVHIAYDDGAYRSLFLRSVMASEEVASFTVDFVLEPAQ